MNITNNPPNVCQRAIPASYPKITLDAFLSLFMERYDDLSDLCGSAEFLYGENDYDKEECAGLAEDEIIDRLYAEICDYHLDALRSATFDVWHYSLSRAAEEFLPDVVGNLCIFEPQAVEWFKKLLDRVGDYVRNDAEFTDLRGLVADGKRMISTPPEVEFFDDEPDQCDCGTNSQ